ncbi:MAG: PDZ domain-containing protein [Planctomycetota bacterium]
MKRLYTMFFVSIFGGITSAQTIGTVEYAHPRSMKCAACHQSDESPSIETPDQATLQVANIVLSDSRYSFAYHPLSNSINLGLNQASALDSRSYRLELLSDPILRSHLRINREGGVIVKGNEVALLGNQASFIAVVSEKEPVDAEVMVGDVFLAVEGDPITDPMMLQVKADEDSEAILTVERIREGRRQIARISASHFASPPKQYQLGVLVEPASDALLTHLGLKDQGLLVTEVVKDSPAAKAKLQVHDVLIEMVDHPLKEVKDLREANQSSGGDQVALSLIRAGKMITVSAQPEVVPNEKQPLLICPVTGSK